MQRNLTRFRIEPVESLTCSNPKLAPLIFAARLDIAAAEAEWIIRVMPVYDSVPGSGIHSV